MGTDAEGLKARDVIAWAEGASDRGPGRCLKNNLGL